MGYLTPGTVKYRSEKLRSEQFRQVYGHYPDGTKGEFTEVVSEDSGPITPLLEPPLRK